MDGPGAGRGSAIRPVLNPTLCQTTVPTYATGALHRRSGIRPWRCEQARNCGAPYRAREVLMLERVWASLKYEFKEAHGSVPAT